MTFHHIPMDGQRILTIAAFDALIEVSLHGGSLVPSTTARHLVERLANCGLADVSSTADSLTMQLYGITANGGTALALLRNWQSAARDRVGQRGALL